MNTFKTAVLLAALTALFMVIGFAITPGSYVGPLVALGFAGVMNFFAYWSSDKLALRMARAREVSVQEAPRLHSIVEEVAAQGGLPKPRVYIVDTPTPNAFATGRNPKHAAVAVTTGIMNILDERELRGVIGHEMAHVRNRDILTGSIVATLAGAISMLAWMALWFRGSRGYGQLISLAAFLLAPLAAALIQAGISRSREYQADASGARLTHDPDALASALLKLQRGVAVRPMEATPAAESTAHLYIINPFRAGGIVSLFSTHPPVEERVQRLQQMTLQGF